MAFGLTAWRSFDKYLFPQLICLDLLRGIHALTTLPLSRQVTRGAPGGLPSKTCHQYFTRRWLVAKASIGELQINGGPWHKLLLEKWRCLVSDGSIVLPAHRAHSSPTFKNFLSPPIPPFIQTSPFITSMNLWTKKSCLWFFENICTCLIKPSVAQRNKYSMSQKVKFLGPVSLPLTSSMIQAGRWLNLFEPQVPYLTNGLLARQ